MRYNKYLQKSLERMCRNGQTGRFRYILSSLVQKNLPFRIQTVNKTRNIIVPFGDDIDWVIMAHYDSFKGLPGANDNGLSCIILLELAERLFKAKNFSKNISIVFTDKEENLATGEPLTETGSFVFAEDLHARGIPAPKGTLVVDTLGIGTNLVISARNHNKEADVYKYLTPSTYACLPSDNIILDSLKWKTWLLTNIGDRRATFLGNLHTIYDTPEGLNYNLADDVISRLETLCLNWNK